MLSQSDPIYIGLRVPYSFCETVYLDYTLVYLIIVQGGINVQVEKFLKVNKRAGWNKSVQDGKFQKINKICCTIIRETKVRLRSLEMTSM